MKWIQVFNSGPIHFGFISLSIVSPGIPLDQQLSILYLKQLWLFGAVDEYASCFIQITSSNLVLPSIYGLTTDSVMEYKPVAAVAYPVYYGMCLSLYRQDKMFRGNFWTTLTENVAFGRNAHSLTHVLPFWEEARAVIVYLSLNTVKSCEQPRWHFSFPLKKMFNETLQG